MPSVGRLRYLEAPAASSSGRVQGTLVLIHAFPMSARMWEPQLGLAQHGWRIIAPQLRLFGGGHSAQAPATSMDDYAGDVVDLLDTLHVDSAVIGGLSMGGYVAFAVFRHAARYVRGLILADTRPQADTPESVEARKRMLALVREKGPAGVADEMLPKLLGSSTLRARPDLAEHVRQLVLQNSTEAISGALSALMTRPDSTPLLSAIHVPTLVLVGEEDVLTPPALSEAMHDGVAGSELVRIPGAGHLSNLEQPEAFNASLTRFLTRRV